MPDRMMDAVDHLEVLRTERQRIVSMLRDADLDALVPTCPDWRLADLVWHLAAGTTFWHRSITEGLANPEEVIDGPQPPDDELAASFERSSAALVDALAARPAEAPCWSWHPEGGSIGWVRRRQAHELHIHRIDVEQSTGAEASPSDPDVAADGVDEMLTVFLSGTPSWASFEADDMVVRFVATDRDRTWNARFGRCVGTPPGGGPVELDSLELDSLELVDWATADLTVSGTATELDRWLWGRSDRIDRHGDEATFERLVDLVREVTG